MNDKILIVVDYQHDFVDGVLPVVNSNLIKDNIQKLINDKKYKYVIYTFDTHVAEEYEVSEEKNLFPDIHCEWKTNGWQLFEIKPRNYLEFQKKLENSTVPQDIHVEDEFFFVKNEFDIWSGNKNYENFFEKMFDKNIQIDICGVALNYCVYQNVIGMVKRGYKVNIIKNAVEGIKKFPNGVVDISYKNNVENMKDFGVKFI